MRNRERMPSNDITLTKVDPPEIQTKLLAKSIGKIDWISEIIKGARRKLTLELLWFLWPIRNKPFVAKVNREDRFYSVGSDCNGCGSCAKVCPLGNIEMVDARPQWLGRCQQCLASGGESCGDCRAKTEVGG